MQDPYQHNPYPQHPSSAPTAFAAPAAGPQSYGYDPRAAELARLAGETRTWTIVVAIGWFVGFMWVLGPLAWYQASRIAEGYAAAGVQPPQEHRNLRLIGMITTILSAIFAALTALVVVAYVAFFLTAAVR